MPSYNPVTGQQIAAAQARAAAFLQQDPIAGQFIAKQALNSQRTVLTLPYYSTIRFASTRSGAGPYVYTVATGTRTAFAYKIGGQATIAGFASSYTPDASDTNLDNENVTRNNETVEIHGIAADFDPNGNPTIAKWVARNCVLSLNIGGDVSPILGRLSFLPSAGGFSGAGVDKLLAPSLADSVQNVGALVNGNPQAGNYYKLPVPITWRGAGGQVDTSFNIVADLKKSLAITLAERAAAAGTTQAIVAPADGADGTFCDVTFRLIGVRSNARSGNV